MRNAFERNKAEVQQSALGFVTVELQLVRTFCRRGQETKDVEKRKRNMQYATKAFQSAAKAFQNFNEPGDDWTSVKAELDKVERELTYAATA